MPGVGRPMKKAEALGIVVGLVAGSCVGTLFKRELWAFSTIGALIGFVIGDLSYWLQERSARKEREEIRESVRNKS